MDWLPGLAARPHAEIAFKDWTQRRVVQSLSTNAGAPMLPFQTWHRFKEAFAPELVARAVEESPKRVRHILDVFGGSGTTALAAQFLGINSTTVEVNPFLAEVIRAKTYRYDSKALVYDLGRVVRAARSSKGRLGRFRTCPPTFIEPGVKGRYLFNANIAERIAAILDAAESLSNPAHTRFFRVILGGVLAGVSNACVSGKGRRYRSGWESRVVRPATVVANFVESASKALVEIHGHTNRPRTLTRVLNEDARKAVRKVDPADLAVFSPPYPNSFDYTDVYNLELWMLGYLHTSRSNQRLRQATLTSHVQIKRDFAKAPQGSARLNRILARLNKMRAELWSPWIPEMIGAYFADMGTVLSACSKRLSPQGQIWMVVGDSRYSGVRVPVDQILIDLSRDWGLELAHREPFRSMRVSPQQGGHPGLTETLVVLARRSS
jgi:hypothetical protein